MLSGLHTVAHARLRCESLGNVHYLKSSLGDSDALEAHMVCDTSPLKWMMIGTPLIGLVKHIAHEHRISCTLNMAMTAPGLKYDARRKQL
jgi:hypothetical protein